MYVVRSPRELVGSTCSAEHVLHMLMGPGVWPIEYVLEKFARFRGWGINGISAVGGSESGD